VTESLLERIVAQINAIDLTDEQGRRARADVFRSAAGGKLSFSEPTAQISTGEVKFVEPRGQRYVVGVSAGARRGRGERRETKR